MVERKKSVGRNEPCPCGSGLKYKKCCLTKSDEQIGNVVSFPSMLSQNTHDNESPTSLTRESFSITRKSDESNGINSDLRAALGEHEFKSVDEAQAFVSQFMNERNNSVVQEFHGISPTQMRSMFIAPFDSPLLMTWNEYASADINAPFLLFFNELLMAIGNNNFKPTKTGNLPRQFCRSVALKYWGEARYAFNTRFGNINSEPDFTELNAFRHTCEIAGYLRKYKGKYIVGKQCQRIMNSGGLSAVYRGLFETFNMEFNWGFTDRYPELDLIQRSWAFSLYLLQLHGDDWKPTSFYEDAFLAAFPTLVESVYEQSWTTPEDLIKSCYRHRVINHWMSWFGLAEIDDLDSKNPLSKNIRIRKTALADEIISFSI